MTQDLLERTVRDWVGADPKRGTRTLDRLAGPKSFDAASKSTAEVAEALIRLAGRMEIADSRLW